MERLQKALDLARAERDRKDCSRRGNAGEPTARRSAKIRRSRAHASGQRRSIGAARQWRHARRRQRSGRPRVQDAAHAGPAATASARLEYARSDQPDPKDGKTFTAINLAIAIAGDTNHTTLLVDFDLRNPSVHQRFGIQPEIGVEQCLRGEAAVSEALLNPAGLSQAGAAARS